MIPGTLHRRILLQCSTLDARAAKPNVRSLHVAGRLCFPRLPGNAKLHHPARSVRSAGEGC